MAQDRDTFRQLAELRLAEAELLHKNGHPSGAYYLAGYAIECALKAKIASGFRANEIPDLKRVSKIYSHNLATLRDLAGFDPGDLKLLNESKELRVSWETVSQWSEQARYETWTKEQASGMLEAVSGNDGLLAWVLKRL